jgi:hypothetical protein
VGGPESATATIHRTVGIDTARTIVRPCHGDSGFVERDCFTAVLLATNTISRTALGEFSSPGGIEMYRLAWIMGLTVVLVGRAPATAADEKIDVKVLEANLEKALKAYNSDDSKGFWAEFCKAADPLKTKETFDALYTNGYKKLYGKLVKRGDLMKDKSVLDGEIGLARYNAEFEKGKKLEIDVNWVKEDKTIKFMQIQINKTPE